MEPVLKKKLKKAKKDPVYFARKFLKNTDFKPLKVEPQQAAFLRDPSTFRSLKWSRRSGKSAAIAIESLHKCIFYKGKNIFIISADSSKVEEFGIELDGMIHRSDFIPSSVLVDNRQSKVFANRSRIKMLTGGSKSGSQGTSAVGGSATDLYLDEIQDIDEDNVRIILPTVIGQLTPPKLVISGTPRTREDFTDELFKDHYQITIDGQKTKKTKNIHGAYSYHEFRICEVTEEDKIINVKSPRVTPESLRLLQRSMGPLFFRREFCLEYVDNLTSVYPEELRDACGILGKPATFRSENLSMAGLDYGRQRANSVLCIAEYNNQQKRWEAKWFKTWPLGTKYQTVNHWVNTVLPSNFPGMKFMLFDETGVGKAAGESLELTKKPYKQGYIFTQPSKTSMVENAVALMETQKYTYYRHPILHKEMKAYSRDLSPQDRIIYKKGESDDFVDALNLTALAIHMYENNASKYGPLLKSMNYNNFIVPRNLGTNALGGRNINNITDQNIEVIMNNPYISSHPTNLRQARMNRGRRV
jgi:hypothetical protein